MDEKDRDLEAARAKPEMAAADKSRPPTGLSTKQGDAGDAEKIVRRKSEIENDDTSAYSSEAADHGEPDLEHEEVEEAVPGHELDRQLSRVGLPRRLHRLPSVSFASCTGCAADASFPSLPHRSMMSRLYEESSPAVASSPRFPAYCPPSRAGVARRRMAKASAGTYCQRQTWTRV